MYLSERPAMNDPLFEFVPSVFFRVLTVALALVAVGFAISIRVYHSIAVRDVIGTLICVPIATYLVHLWIVHGRERESDE